MSNLVQRLLVQQPAARLRGVTHRYGAVEALSAVDIELPGGCVVGFIGPDGVGKSTLLGLVAGARAVQTGSVEVLDGDMADTAHRRAVCPRIAYMPQGLGQNLYATLSVFENVDFFGRLFGHARAERAARIAELLQATGLAPFADRPAGKLSGGMKQKLGLCCALIHDPDLLVLDEPTTGIDPLSRRQFWELIDRIRARRAHMSVLVATAYMDEAERFDWLVAMNAGRVLANGTPAGVREQAGARSLEAAFIALLPEAARDGQRELVVPPRPAHHAEVAIEANALTRRFDSFTAVDGVSFRIERGEIFGFLGSNGCGKTTTMKMLTGLLPATEGSASLFGRPIDARDIDTRRRVGYMSQSFSLYRELTVRQNLELHARLFHLPAGAIPGRVRELVQSFGLAAHIDAYPDAMPLGLRQRLSLAVAVIHRPEMLILDEPTSGVDPLARDGFWQLMIDLSRRDGVTIFISTHIMNEAERCDRISLMHDGRVLASDSPAALIAASGGDTLEAAFIEHLEQATGAATAAADTDPPPLAQPTAATDISAAAPRHSSLQRMASYAHRESLELLRDPIRLVFALIGTVLLMFILGYGISMDVKDLPFAVLDGDRSTESRTYLRNFEGSRYFVARAPIANHAELDHRLRTGELSLAIEVPPGFGRDLKRGARPEIGVWIDGAMPFRAETILGYVQGAHFTYLSELSYDTLGTRAGFGAADVAVRYRYNQDVSSLDAMVPAVIPLLLIFVPAMLMALGVVREKELGSIVNLYVTPVTRLEFLFGKQLPYVALGMFNFFCLVLLAVFMFGVPLKGSLPALTLGALLYLIAATGLGLLVSAFTRTQIAAIFAAGVATMLPAVLFSGMTHPVSSLEGGAAIVGKLYPTTWFLLISRGAFSKALGFADLYPYLLALAAFLPAFTIASVLLLKKQGK